MADPKPARVVVGRGELIRMSAPRGTGGSRSGRSFEGAKARPYVSTKEFFPMGIFSRTRDIIAANVTDLLDKAEDPAKMIRMIILEMEETLVEVRASAARTIADQKEMRRQITKLDRLQDSWVEKAELALSKDREDLAKAALFEKQKAADMAGQLKTEIEVLDDALRASEGDIAKLQTKLREARARQNAIMTRMESAQNRARLRELYSGPKVDDAFSRFDVLERHADLAEGHADALSLGAPLKSLDEEISELRNSEKVDAELEALKASLAKRTNGGEAANKEG
jgi:phage shock protein A